MIEATQTPAAPPDDDRAAAAEERRRLTYQGHKLPWIVVLVWIVFFVFGLAYFVRHLR